MPRMVRLHSIGGPENLKLEEVELRPPGEGEAKLRVQAVGLNRAESGYMRGHYFEKPEIPSAIGYEAAGIVESVGPGVNVDWVGKQVATVPGFSMNRYGVLGEEAIVPASSLAEYPPNLTSAEAAAIWMQYLTAYGALVLFGGVKLGDFVLITAASSSVGLAAIQIVKAEGGTPIATSRTSSKRKELLAAGAAFVIAADEEDIGRRVGEITGDLGARIIFDPIGGPTVEKLAEAGAFHGIIFQYGSLSMLPTPFPIRILVGKGLSMRAYSIAEVTHYPQLLKAAKQYVFDRLADGRFRPKIAKQFPLDQFVEAYQYLESNQQVGKIVVTL
jgi:NADPH:quinone reductase-like Zn-dependent oxidoreductase